MVAKCPDRHLGRRRWVCLAGSACLVIGASIYSAHAQEPKRAKDDSKESLAARRYEVLRQRVASARVQSDEPGFPAQFGANPIFRYSDPARGYVAAAVWKLGDEGRPKALLTTELDRRDHGAPCISYEYLSMTDRPFSVVSSDIGWSPSATQLRFTPIPNAPAPEKTAPRRLIQIRELARRFASREDVKTKTCELRLLPAPVDRYTPSNADRADGAILFFTFGTNPEVVLFLESDGKSWSYAVSRMTGAETVVLSSTEPSSGKAHRSKRVATRRSRGALRPSRSRVSDRMGVSSRNERSAPDLR